VEDRSEELQLAGVAEGGEVITQGR